MDKRPYTCSESVGITLTAKQLTFCRMKCKLSVSIRKRFFQIELIAFSIFYTVYGNYTTENVFVPAAPTLGASL